MTAEAVTTGAATEEVADDSDGGGRSNGLTHSECKGNLRNLAAKIKRNKTN